MGSSNVLTDYDLQAVLFGNYLLSGKAVTPHVKDLYDKTMQNTAASLDAKDKRILQYAIEHPWAIGLFDAGCAITRPDAELRRRLYIMFAILEANTEYWGRFLPKKHSPLYLFVIMGAGIRGAAKAGVGALLIKAIV